MKKNIKKVVASAIFYFKVYYYLIFISIHFLFNIEKIEMELISINKHIPQQNKLPKL